MPRFISQTPFDHQQRDKIGVLITNLGTPAAPTPAALRRYLKQFLSDPRVVEIPKLLWWLILNGIILRIRPAKSARAYASVWRNDGAVQGSPLAIYTANQAQKLADNLTKKYGDNLYVDWAMRYGEPSMSSKIDSLLKAGVRKLIVLPLYPQYSGSTTASTFDAIAADFTHRRWLPELRFINHYCDHPGYIDALASHIKKHWQRHGKPQKLILSYHGVPLRYLQQGDPYHCQCLKTTRLLVDKLHLTADEYISCFQSRFGKATWLQPYTDATLKSLPSQGVKNIQVICPGFSSDCLETLEEIEEENRTYFMEAGGETFSYIPALNDSDEHIEFLQSLIEQNLHGWCDKQNNDTVARQKAYEACPFNKH